MSASDTPTLGPIRRTNGIAGQFAYSVEVTYPGDLPGTVQFIGHADGGPIILVTSGGRQTFVDDPGRFGPELSPEWVRRFFA